MTGQTVLITGATRGLGRALAGELGRRGARVVVVARGRKDVDQTVAALRDEDVEAHGVVGDVGKAGDCGAIVAQAQRHLGGHIDVLINNASTLGPTPLRLLNDTELDDLTRVLAVNLTGPFLLTRALVPAMELRGKGTVMFISSDAAVSPYAAWGAYGVSKAALDHLGRIWAEELGDSGVTMISVDPGEMDTQMHADAMPEADRTTLADPAIVARTIADLLDDGAKAAGARVEAQALAEINMGAAS